MELIDKQKILEWRSEKLRECADYGNISGSEVLTMLREAIESGTFNDHSAQEEIAKLKEERNALLDVIESLYQIIQRGDLTSFDLTQADEVYESTRSIIAKIEGK